MDKIAYDIGQQLGKQAEGDFSLPAGQVLGLNNQLFDNKSLRSALTTGADTGMELGTIGGAAAGAGGGALFHYLMAGEKKRRLRDYLTSMLAGGGLGGAAGAFLGQGVGRMTAGDAYLDDQARLLGLAKANQ
jgi:hypothetical protein